MFRNVTPQGIAADLATGPGRAPGAREQEIPGNRADRQMDARLGEADQMHIAPFGARDDGNRQRRPITPAISATVAPFRGRASLGC